MATNQPQDEFQKTALRLPKELHVRLHAAAAANGRSYNAEIVSRLQDSFNAEQESVAITLDPEVRELIEASAREKGVGAGDEVRRLLAAPVSLTEINHVLLKQISRDQREILSAMLATPGKPKK